jgi:hypothetical protein
MTIRINRRQMPGLLGTAIQAAQDDNKSLTKTCGGCLAAGIIPTADHHWIHGGLGQWP